MGQKKSAKKPTTLPLYHFATVSRTVRSILAQENADHNRACVFYAVIGAMILKYHYRIDARPVGGAAFYRLNDTGLAFVLPDGGPAKSDGEHFHFWIETNEWAIDFMAPYFPEVVEETSGQHAPLPRKGFQRKLSDAKSTVEELQKSGDFLYVPNDELTKTLQETFRSTPAYMDLLGISVQDWYKPPPKLMAPELQISNKKGEITRTPLLDLELTGFW